MLLLKGGVPLTSQACACVPGAQKVAHPKENMISFSLDQQPGWTDCMFASEDVGEMAVHTWADAVGNSPQ